MKNYIHQLNGKEQNAVYGIKNLLASQLNACIIYCFGCQSQSKRIHSAFLKKQIKEEHQFTCDLLIITPNAETVDAKKRTEIHEMLAHLATVNMWVHPLELVVRKMNEGNVFFNWVRTNGMLLLDRNNSTQLLPAPMDRSLRRQAEEFYVNDPTMQHYSEVNFQPKVKVAPKNTLLLGMQPIEIKLTIDTVFTSSKNILHPPHPQV